MSRPRITLVDLAGQLGLSVTTVSDALQGSGRVAAGTRERVRAAAASAGYVPDRGARDLRRRRSSTVALFVPQRVRGMEFYLTFALAVADRLGEDGFDLTLLSSSTDAVDDDWRRFAGVIVVDATMDDPRLAANADRAGILVTAGRIEGLPETALAGIIEANYRALITEVLDAMAADSPIRRPVMIAHAPADAHSWSRQLIEGYESWCADRGIAPVTGVIGPDLPAEDVDAAADLLEAHGDADVVILGGSVLAMSVREAQLRRHAGSPPQRSIVVTTSRLEAALVPSEVALQFRAREFGLATADLLLDRIAADEMTREHLWFDPHVIIDDREWRFDSGAGQLRPL